jgi:3-hydroxyacyl-[acyl-carrier-protein] dehydratase
MKNDFYRISAFEKSEDKLSCTLHYDAAHEIFQGHFPGNPIVPGVCTMAIVKELLEEALQQTLMLKESKTVKFLGLIDPSMSPAVSLSWKEEAGHIHATASLQDGSTALFKMSGNYVPAAKR